MVICVDNTSRVVLLAGDGLTAEQIAAQMSGWCAEYQLTDYTAYTVASLPDGFVVGGWTYAVDGAWEQIPAFPAPAVTDSSSLLKFINPDISDDKVAQYLLKELSLAQVTETVNHAVLPGALEEGCIAYLPDIVYETAKQIILQAGDINKQATQIELLNDRISLKLNSNGHVAGMAIGWDESGDISETVFLNDVFKIVLSNGGDPVTAFVEHMVDGVPTTSLNGDLIVDGLITARMMHVDVLQSLTHILGDGTTYGKIETYDFENKDTGIQILDGPVPTINVKGGNISADSIKTGVLTVKSSKSPYTAGDDNCRIIKGQISGVDGAILHGVGFTCERLDVGTYGIAYAEPFIATPLIVATIMEAGTDASTVKVFAPFEGAAIIQTFEASGIKADHSFNFITIGND